MLLSVLHAAAECAPFVKVGGLGDVLGSLPQAVAGRGLSVSVIVPRYGSINARRFRLKKIPRSFRLMHNKKLHHFSVFHGRLPQNPVQYYFIDHPLFRSTDVYVDHARYRAPHNSYTRSETDVERFTLFSLAVVEFTHQAALPIDIIHCHDWHTALIPTFVDELAVTKSYRFTKTIFTIHNLANQGITPKGALKDVKTRRALPPYLLEDYHDVDGGKLNLMKLGILSADRITTVSPTYAHEILDPGFGAGLEKYLMRREQDLVGILNGIDLDAFNPTTDPLIHRRYSRTTWKRIKPANKQTLQRQFGLPVKDVPVYGMVSRLVYQKGVDLLLKTLPRFFEHGAQVVILGSGEPHLETALADLARSHKTQCSVSIGFNLARAQQVYAGADFFLMPSRYEPCGLGQMIAMRYGTVPIVRSVGGLADTVRHNKNGIVFRDYSPRALINALSSSVQLYRNKKRWYTVVQNAMRETFSWERSARAYLSLYRKLL